MLSLTLLALAALSFTSCKKEDITLSMYNLWFPKEAGIQEINLTSNCAWSISIDDDADWYTVTPMAGKRDAVLVVTIQPIGEKEQRRSTFTVTSKKGDVQHKVSVSQNTLAPPELTSLNNTIFAVLNLTHWNTDFFGNVIEDSYESHDYDPADTTKGYFMYFFEDGTGVQRDNSRDTTVYYQFTYVYDAFARNFHIEFETVTDTLEIYDAPVLAATPKMFRFQHEWKPDFWELSDLQRVGTITPQEKSFLKRKAKKRKGDEPIFIGLAVR